MRRAGRRPGPSGTREAILGAARASFAERGYEQTTIRGIARQAGVDPALVHHFFGTKEAVFAAAMDLPVNPGELVGALLSGNLDGVGERLVRMLLTVWDPTTERSPLLALVRSAVSHEHAAGMLRQFITKAVLGRLAAAIELPHPELRATLAGSQVVGLIMVRYVIKVEPLASADAETVVACIAPTLQRYLTGDLGDIGGAGAARTV